jgi:hypothetical protein
MLNLTDMKIIPLLAFAAVLMTTSCNKSDNTPAPDRNTASIKNESEEVQPRENIIKKKKPVNDAVPKPL